MVLETHQWPRITDLLFPGSSKIKMLKISMCVCLALRNGSWSISSKTAGQNLPNTQIRGSMEARKQPACKTLQLLTLKRRW